MMFILLYSSVIVIVVVLLYKYCGASEDSEKFILEVDPEDDIRENVMNYDEEGAGRSECFFVLMFLHCVFFGFFFHFVFFVQY